LAHAAGANSAATAGSAASNATSAATPATRDAAGETEPGARALFGAAGTREAASGTGVGSRAERGADARVVARPIAVTRTASRIGAPAERRGAARRATTPEGRGAARASGIEEDKAMVAIEAEWRGSRVRECARGCGGRRATVRESEAFWTGHVFRRANKSTIVPLGNLRGAQTVAPIGKKNRERRPSVRSDG
jgi:hypothetical protein